MFVGVGLGTGGLGALVGAGVLLGGTCVFFGGTEVGTGVFVGIFVGKTIMTTGGGGCGGGLLGVRSP